MCGKYRNKKLNQHLMGKKPLLSTIILFLLSASLYAQTGKIAGRVIDTNGDPLPGVNVIIDETTTGTSTDSDGYYTILNLSAGTYVLKATYIGFATVKVEDVQVEIGLTTEINFTLSEQLIEGEEIVVIAEKPVIKKDVSSSLASINKSELEALPITSVTSAIGLQAGIEGLSVRGSGSDEVSFNLNGLSLRSERDNTPFTGISVTSIENVQVQTGGFNAEYGDVRSGVVNVTSKEGNPDRYTLDGIIRVTPPQAKNFGQSVNDPDSYWIRPYLDDDVAWTGTDNGNWDVYTQREYPVFQGWNAVSQELLADDDPSNDLTPEGAQQLFLWQHRKKMEIDESDYEIDLTLGGPVPFISEKLGNLRFSTSLRKTNTEYFIPLSKDAYESTTWMGKITSNIASGMKLSFDGLYGIQTGTGSSQSGNPGFFVSPTGIAGSMDQVSYIDTRIYASDYWAPTKVTTSNFGAQFTHTVTNSTFYEVKLSRLSTKNSTNPGPYREGPGAVTIGGLDFDEGPFGFYEDQSSGIGSGMRMGIGMSNSRDSSEVSVVTGSFAITSQLDRVNQVKAGLELIRTHSNINYGSYDKNLPSGRYTSKWDTTPIRLSAYVQDKLEFKGMIANVGLRFTYADPNIDWYDYDTFDDVFKSGGYANIDSLDTYRVKPQLIVQPRLGVAFPITDNSKLFFNYGHFLQLPDPEDLYLVRVEPFTNSIVRIAAPENKIPKTVSYELGYEQNLFNKYLFRISGYYKDLSQQPVVIDVYGSNDGSYSVSKPYSYEDIRGLEITLKKQPSDLIWGEVSYTYSVRSSGLFGSLEVYENSFEQRDYDRSTNENDIYKPIPQPYARLQLYMKSPTEFGPKVMGGNPLADWNFSTIISWSAGSYITYTGGGSIPGVVRNFQLRDSWSTSLRVSKEIKFNQNQRINFFMDVSNVLNQRVLNIFNMGAVTGTDYLDYMASLHLPKDKLEEINLLNARVPGNDRPGDYRAPDIEYVPIEVTTDHNNVSNPNTRALYYNSIEAKYYQYVNGSFVDADSDKVKKVLEDKAYINMPDQRFFNFFNPRTFRFGIRFSF